jgi:peptidylprolyl isomerase
MARAQSPDSADSQFFMMLGKHTHLDGAYTAFAKIVEGGELVTTIKQGDAIESFSIA